MGIWKRKFIWINLRLCSSREGEKGVVVCETKKFLGSKFDMKDLGEAKVILGIKITRTPNGA
ncbi:hypothetical protein CK203_098472 [Vitis vinifera]|uniref:Uncharacterized protein n=1 Tax=Vitis vinifera TaxID=29760 RepID=A0A438FIN9_VITVI|nr:hypothetical protein CK203_098472 [Vitis vinifera]